MINLNIMRVVFPDVEIQQRDIPKLRGFFCAKYPQLSELHHHLPSGKYDYRYPLVQFRLLDKHPALLGINAGCTLVSNLFMQTQELTIQNETTPLYSKEIFLKTEKFGSATDRYTYRFLSPWMGLNESNHQKYKQLSEEERKPFLEHILRENLKTIAKGVQYTIPNSEEITVASRLSAPFEVNFKGQKMLSFKGVFTMNFLLPDLLGLGKQSARGFGVVEQIKREER